MNTKLHNRILSALLAMLLFLSCLPAPGVLAQGEQEQFVITYEGEALTEISFPRNEKRRISADNLPEDYEYRWQIKMPREETWVDIMGQEGQTLVLSYALLKNMMDDSGNAAVRCAAVEEGEMIAYTEPLRAFVTAPVQPADPEPPEEETTEPTGEATEATEEPTEATEEPTEATEEPTETTEETTEATEEATEAAGEPTEPTQETTEATEETTEATEEPTESTEETTEPTEETTEATEETEASTETAGETGGETLMANLLNLLTLRASAEELTEAAEADGDTAEGQAAGTDIVTVTIQYVYWDRLTDQPGEQVWDPYTASIQSGTDFSVTVANKTVPAYEPVLASGSAGAVLVTDPTTQTSSVQVDLTAVTEDTTFTVYYKEIMVPYKARYYLQNINNDLYTEDTTIPESERSFEGYKGESPSKDALEKPIPGFTSLFHQPDFIAADGSTVFEIYYDRNYYLINFDLDGGYGTAPVYARYQTTFTVAQPEKPGYVFNGWKLIKRDGETVTDSQVIQTLPTTIPAENQTYQAVWGTELTEYTVVYWRENNFGTGYDFWGAVTKKELSGQYVSGEDNIPESISTIVVNETDADDKPIKTEVNEAKYYKINNTKTDKDVLINGDGSTIVNVYYDRKEYRLRFYFAKKDGNKFQVATNTNGSSGENGTVVDASWNGSYADEPSLNSAFDSAKEKNYATHSSETINGALYSYIDITAKYNENLTGIWPAAWINDVNNNGSPIKFVSWGTQYGSGYYTKNKNKNIKGTYQRLDFNIIMDPEKTSEEVNHVLVAYWSGNPTTYQYNIYYDLLPGETEYDTVYNNINYTLEKTDKVLSTDGVKGQSPLPYEGVTLIAGPIDNVNEPEVNGENVGSTNRPNQVDFYYARNIRKLYYRNYNENMGDGNGASIQYGRPLAIYDYFDKEEMETVYYPAGLEPNAYEFEGWYTTSDFIPGTEMDWSGTMPDSDITVYAKWVPITHDVEFYMDYDEYEAGKLYGKVEDVTHGTVMTYPDFNLVPTHTNSNYRFVKWFYIQDGKKVAFEPTAMTVQKDLKLYAEWTSSITTKYTIYYVKGTQKADGSITYDKDNPEYVADPTVGYAFQATTKSFNAKPEEELNRLTQEEKDQGIWLPLTGSHSILMKADEDDNTFTFVYVTKEVMPYTVKHVDITTGAVLASETVSDNKKSVVTEQFKYFSGYVADDFHKTLILSADPQENVITFYYTKTETPPEGGGTGEGDSRYKVVHLIQDLDENGQPTNTYSEYTSNSYVAPIKSIVTAEYLNIPGYRPDYRDGNEDNQVSGIVKSGEDDGDNKALILELYYNRQEYNYEVKYVERGTNKVLIEKEDTDEASDPYYGTDLGGTAYFGNVLSRTAPAIKGYDLYSSSPQTLTISSEEARNVIIFEYVQKTVTIYYEAVCTEDWAVDFGIPSQSKETPKDTDTISGAQAIPKSGFRFVGWYRDEACTDKIEEDSWFADGNRKHLKPRIDFSDEIYEYTYYALFEAIDYTVTYNANGGQEVPSKIAHIGESVTLPTTTREGYTLLYWWYDADEDDEMDEGETYVPGSGFTMPPKDVTFTAQWIDSRVDDSQKVFVGINMSFYKDGDQLYYSFPPGEPIVVELEAARAYIEAQGENGNTWKVQEYYWDKNLPGKFSDYIAPEIIESSDLEANGDVIGVYDESGVKTKKYLYLSEDDYKGIVQAWLNARGYFKDRYPNTNIDWDSLPNDTSKYKVIPYVVKRHYHVLTKKEDWFIDVIVVPEFTHRVYYQLNLPEGFNAEPPDDPNEYGQGFVANVKTFHDVVHEDDPNSIAKFQGWHYDADKNGTIDEGEVYAGGTKLVVPAEDVTLTAIWSYYAPLTVSQTGLGEKESAIYHITGNGVDLKIALTGEDQTTVILLPMGEYTVTEISGWTWKYKNTNEPSVTITEPEKEGQDSAKVTVDNSGIHSQVHFIFPDAAPDWLHGENHKENIFAPVQTDP